MLAKLNYQMKASAKLQITTSTKANLGFLKGKMLTKV
jgi:hypothetical protein